MSSPRFISAIFTAVLTVLFSTIMPAQSLPSLPPDPDISTGTLANGMTYYIAVNARAKGSAEVVVVQKSGYGNDGTRKGAAVVHGRASLGDLRYFGGKSPSPFMKKRGLWPREDGYIDTRRDATVFRFRGMALSRSKEIVDSTLLLAFDVAGRDSGLESSSYTPDNQAIIIAGDIDKAAVLEKMNLLSMLVRKGYGMKTEADTSMAGTAGRTVSVTHGAVLARAQICFRFGRTPQNAMGTIVPLVSERYLESLRIIAARRLGAAFQDSGIPVSTASAGWKSSRKGPGDDYFKVEIETSGTHIRKAVETAAGVLSGLDAGNTSEEEYSQAVRYMESARLARGTSNTALADRCISAFLYGASLSAESTEIEFFSARKRAPERSLALFNNFVSALLDSTRNVTIDVACDTSLAGPREIGDSFSSGWKAPSGYSPAAHVWDRPQEKVSKIKLKSTAADPMLGGTVWTFSNGIKVVFRKCGSDGRFSYAWALRGGFGQMERLYSGEGAYLHDLFLLCGPTGRPDDISIPLGAEGLSVDADISLTEFVLRGHGRKESVPKLFDAIYSLAYCRQPSPVAWDYYRKCEALRAMMAPAAGQLLDSLMHKDLIYSRVKRGNTLNPDLQNRAEKFFESRFRRMEDGVLVIAGDLDEYELKKTLRICLAAFHTEKSTSYRSRIRSTVSDGRKFFQGRGKSGKIGIALSVPVDFSAGNYMVYSLASAAIKDAVSGAALSHGWYCGNSAMMSTSPQERFSQTIMLSEIPSRGLPASIPSEHDPAAVFASVHASLAALASEGISPSALAAEKAAMSDRWARLAEDPDEICNLLILRYSFSKDIVSGREAAAAAATKAQVDAAIRAILAGSRAEIVLLPQDSGISSEKLTLSVPLPESPRLKPLPGTYPDRNNLRPAENIDLGFIDSLKVTVYPPDTSAAAVPLGNVR